MRILHTSDWHLGRSFHGFSLHHFSEEILDELLQTICEEHIDVLLISGDVYDQAQPRVDTVKLMSSALQKIVAQGVTVIAISGNHDSAPRLGFASDILAAGGLHLMTEPDAVERPVLVEKDGVEVAFYGIPFLEPRSLASRWGVDPSHPAVLSEASRRALADFKNRQSAAAIALTHCFVSGANTSDSERDITVGGVASVGADVFAGFDYAALGHIHGRQKITDTARYSGSLLAYSFSEENHTKGGWILDVDQTGLQSIEPIDWKTTVKLKTVKGKLSELLESPEYAGLEDYFVRIYITDNERPYAAAEQLKTRFNHIAELFFTPENPVENLTSSYDREQFEQKTVQEITEDFYAHVRQRSVNDAETAVLHTATELAREVN